LWPCVEQALVEIWRSAHHTRLDVRGVERAVGVVEIDHIAIRSVSAGPFLEELEDDSRHSR